MPVAGGIRGWTERSPDGYVYLCWYIPAPDPRESRSILTRTLIGRPAEPLECHDCAVPTATCCPGTSDGHHSYERAA